MIDRSFFIVCSLFAGLSVASTQEWPPLSIQKFHDVNSKRRVDYVHTWRSYGDAARTAYILGFMDGEANGNEKGRLFFQGKVDKSVIRQWMDTEGTFAGHTVGILADAMTHLYDDPANSYLPFAWVLYLAKDRIEGKPIEEKLLEARKHAFQ